MVFAKRVAGGDEKERVASKWVWERPARTKPICGRIKEKPPSSQEATATLFNVVKHILHRKPWPLDRQESMINRCVTMCTALLTQGADPNARLGTTSKTESSSWSMMLQYAVKNAQNRDDFQRRLLAGSGGSGFVSRYYGLLVAFIEAGADVNAAVL